MRIVRNGTSGNLYLLTQLDLKDTDLFQSHFEWVDFGTHDLSTFDLRDANTINCDLTKVTGLPAGRMLDYIYSRNSDWPPALIPNNISAKSHDLVVAWLRNKVVSLTGQQMVIANKIIEVADRHYLAGFPEAFAAFESSLGIARATARDIIVADLFDNASHLRAGVQAFFDVVPFTPSPPDLTRVRVSSAPRNFQTVDVSGDLIATNDRWELARHLESVHPELRFWVAQIYPFPIILSNHRQVEYEAGHLWWTDMWPI